MKPFSGIGPTGLITTSSLLFQIGVGVRALFVVLCAGRLGFGTSLAGNPTVFVGGVTVLVAGAVGPGTVCPVMTFGNLLIEFSGPVACVRSLTR